jgi:TetR/AcrR family transcriptional regulator
MRRWMDEGRMDRGDPFLIWAATQTYADFEAQICAVTGKARQTRQDYEHATTTLTRIVLKGCGVGS